MEATELTDAERMIVEMQAWLGRGVEATIVSGRDGQVDLRLDRAKWDRIKSALYLAAIHDW